MTNKRRKLRASVTTGSDDDIHARVLIAIHTYLRIGILRNASNCAIPIPNPKIMNETTHPAGSASISPSGQATAKPAELTSVNGNRPIPTFLLTTIHWNDEMTAPMTIPSRTNWGMSGSDSQPFVVRPITVQPDTMLTK